MSTNSILLGGFTIHSYVLIYFYLFLFDHNILDMVRCKERNCQQNGYFMLTVDGIFLVFITAGCLKKKHFFNCQVEMDGRIRRYRRIKKLAKTYQIF